MQKKIETDLLDLHPFFPSLCNTWQPFNLRLKYIVFKALNKIASSNCAKVGTI